MNKLYLNLEFMKNSGYEQNSIDDAIVWNKLIDSFLQSPIGDHIRNVDAVMNGQEYKESLLNSEKIKSEIEPGSAPCGILFPYGFLPIWASAEGNAIVFNLKDNYFYWLAHISFNHNSITIPSSNKIIPFSPENIPKALTLISKDAPNKFINDLKQGIYTKQLNKLGAIFKKQKVHLYPILFIILWFEYAVLFGESTSLPSILYCFTLLLPIESIILAPNRKNIIFQCVTLLILIGIGFLEIYQPHWTSWENSSHRHTIWEFGHLH